MPVPVVPRLVCKEINETLNTLQRQEHEQAWDKLTNGWTADWHTFRAEELLDIDGLVFPDVHAAKKKGENTFRELNNKHSVSGKHINKGESPNVFNTSNYCGDTKMCSLESSRIRACYLP